MPYAYGLMTMYGITAQLGISSTGEGAEKVWTYAPFGEGIENFSEALNEVVQQYFFMADGGFAKNHVTGMAPTFTCTGRRIFGDAAQDYIFSKKYGLDAERQSSFQITYNDGTDDVTITCDCTIANMQEFSGATTEDSAISFELRFDGTPVVE